MAQPIVQRTVFLTIFVILLLAVAGVTAAEPSGDNSTPSTTPERTSFGPAVSEDLERTVSGGASSGPDAVEEEFDENVPEPTVGLGKGHTLIDPVEEPGTADAVHGLNAGGPREYGRGVGRPERAGKPEERGDERVLTRRGSAKGHPLPQGQEHPYCRRSAPAQNAPEDAHLRHGASLGVCR